MSLPTHEELSANITRTFVHKDDIERFDGYIKSLDEVVTPIEYKAKECDMAHVIEEGHIAETSLELLNKEIVRMIYWSKEDVKSDTERSAKKFKDMKDRYIAARDTLQYNCQCIKKK
jgi:hypothetical protein